MKDFTGHRRMPSHYKLPATLVVFVMFYFLIYLVNPFSEYWKFANRQPFDITFELGLIFVFCYGMVEINEQVSSLMNRYLPWEKRPALRGATQLPLNLAIILLLQFIVGKIVFFLFFEKIAERINHPLSLLEQMDRWRYMFVTIAVTVLIYASSTARYFLYLWRTSALEAAELKLHAAQLKETAMQAELQSLKLQLDPHFMFNNFSTLSELISEDRDAAQLFIDNLSKVYRYMILNIHYDLISLQKELKFIHSYIYLISIRHGDNVRVEMNIPDRALEKQIPPITLQLLIENAIKHNIATAASPLRIKIGVDENNQLQVVNNLQRIDNEGIISSRLGLKNIQERYRLVSGQLPQIQELPTEFVVRLPLLD